VETKGNMPETGTKSEIRLSRGNNGINKPAFENDE
jgi:hypothetical protein